MYDPTSFRSMFVNLVHLLSLNFIFVFSSMSNPCHHCHGLSWKCICYIYVDELVTKRFSISYMCICVHICLLPTVMLPLGNVYNNIYMWMNLPIDSISYMCIYVRISLLPTVLPPFGCVYSYIMWMNTYC